MGKVAVFDFDGTLRRGDSFVDFARFVVGTPRFLLAVLRSFPSLAGWKLGLCSNAVAKQRLFRALYRGMDYGRFKSLGEEFASEDSRKRMNDATWQAFHSHVAAGDIVLVATASVGEWVSPFFAKYGVPVFSTEVEVDSEGMLTGRFSTPNCHGAEKVERLMRAYPRIIDMHVTLYTDSADDAPLMAIAQKVVMVD